MVKIFQRDPVSLDDGHYCLTMAGEDHIEFFGENFHFTTVSAAHYFESGVRNTKKQK